jgi:hypothetical protein
VTRSERAMFALLVVATLVWSASWAVAILRALHLL